MNTPQPYCFDCFFDYDSEKKYENKTLKNRIITIISNYSQDMENDSCLDANWGVQEDNFEDIANDLIKEFNIMFKTTKVV